MHTAAHMIRWFGVISKENSITFEEPVAPVSLLAFGFFFLADTLGHHPQLVFYRYHYLGQQPDIAQYCPIVLKESNYVL